VTRTAARGVAEAVGARHFELQVDGLVNDYLALVSGALGRPLRWETDDVALQNIQARVRGPSVWLIANVEGKLLLTTSNRSEAAAGYATMDGDTCGGLAPIAGIDKAYLRRWLAWLAAQGGEGLGPLPALQAVVNQRSTPELRPQAAKQVSEEDLMPFDVLDAVERLAIRDKLPPVDVFVRLRRERRGDDPAQLAAWIERFFRLFAINQWKRERYAPSFHLDDENLDPKTWFRFPILSGGFARELAELRAFVQKSGAKGEET
jgi:NAD+ synthase (glutamine-hydrolysing)